MTYRVIVYCVLTIIYSIDINSQITNHLKNSSDIIIGSNFRIYPSNVSQSETFIVNHPNDANILFASAYTILTNPFFISEGIYVSTNSGESWTGSDTCNGAPIQFHGGEPAITIDKNGTFLLNRLGRQPTFIGLYSHFSTDNGATWSNQITISPEDLEKHSITSDINPLSSFYGRSYAVYTMLAPPYKVRITYTDNSGQNWVPVFDVNNPPQRCFGTDIAIQKSGDVIVCWAVLSAPPSPFEINIGFGKSTDGGINWVIQESPIHTRGITGILSQKQNIRVNSTPRIAVDNTDSPYSGTIYIVTSQRELAPAGNDPDIVLFKSTNNGNTWSQGIRVNQDPINNGKFQFFPALHIDPSGGINILYLDDRNTTSDSTGVFLSRSTDGGETWTDYEVSDHNFRPTAVSGIGAGNISDHIDITYTNGKLWPVWMDNSTGIYQIWTAPITLPPVSVEEDHSSVQNFALNQNYPNPFNPTTKISWNQSSGSKTTITVYDILGNQIAVLVNGYVSAGRHEVIFNTEELKLNISSGIYFYRLNSGEYSETKLMVLLK